MSAQIQQSQCISSTPSYSGLCARCSHRKTCTSPCAPVEQLLSAGNRKPFERVSGETVIVFPRSRREIRESDLDTYEGGKPTNRSAAVFSTDAGSAFATPEPTLKQTAIFIDRFFNRMSYADLAEKYDTTRSGVAKLYFNAKERMIKSIRAMDRADLAAANGRPLAAMPKAVRVFLLHTLFGLAVNEIARLLDISHSLVVRNIATTRDRIITGRLNLLAFTEADREAAQGRLDDARKKRAAYDAKRTKKAAAANS